MLNKSIISILFFCGSHVALAMDPPQNARKFTVSELVEDGYDESIDPSDAAKLLLEGLQLIKEGKRDALALLYKVARSGHFLAMHSLGLHFLEKGENFTALEWFFLSCQISFLKNDKIHAPAHSNIKALGENRNSGLKTKASTLHYNLELLSTLHKEKDIMFRYRTIEELNSFLYIDDLSKRTNQLHFLLMAVGNPVLICTHASEILVTYQTSPIGSDELLSLVALLSKGFDHAENKQKDAITEVLSIIKMMIYDFLNIEKTHYTAKEYVHLQVLAQHLEPQIPQEANFLGLLYMKGLIFRHLPANERDERAKELFLQSGLSLAYENLATLYWQNRIELELTPEQRIECALACYEKSPSLKAQRNSLALLLNKGVSTLDATQSSLAASVELPKVAAYYFKKAREKAQNYLQFAVENHAYLHYVAGLASFYEFLAIREMHENRWDLLREAESHYVLANTFGKGADNTLKYIGSMLRGHLAEAKEIEAQENIVTPSKALTESEVMAEITIDRAPDQLEPKEEPKTRATKRKTKEEKKLRRIQKARAEALDFIRNSQSNLPATRNFTIVFLNNQVKKQFKALDENKKAQEILADIMLAPWELKGAGKPEILRGSNFKGCFSRRIDGENRLVYRVLKNDKIEIVSCVGHYDI